MAAEQLGEIVIAPRVLEKIIAIATAKVEGVYSFANKSMSDSLSMRSLGRGVSLHTDETGDVTVDIYLYLEIRCQRSDCCSSDSEGCKKRCF